jgi:hypothetical protein
MLGSSAAWQTFFMEKTARSTDSVIAHILLFKCPESGDPVAAATLSSQISLEEVDAKTFPVTCQCGWTGKVLGIERIKNWMEIWDAREAGQV